MKKILFRKDIKQIIFYDTLDILDLNESACFLFGLLCLELSHGEIAQRASLKFNESFEDSLDNVISFQEQLKDLGITPHRGLVGELEFMPHTPIVHIIQNCNSPCTMCDCWMTKGKKWHSRNNLFKIHQKLKSLGAIGIMISGGEPLMHPELEGILLDLKELGLEIYLNTNGILLKNKMDFLTNLHIDELVISLDGINAFDYKTIRGTDKFDLVVENIKLFKEKNPQTRVVTRTTLTKYTLNHLFPFIELAKNIGIDHIGFSPLDVSSESFNRINHNEKRELKLISDLLPSKEEILQIINWIKRSQNSILLSKLEQDGYIAWGPDKIVKCLEFYVNIIDGNERKFNKEVCMFPFFSLLVDYDGSLRGCFYDTSFGNINDFENIDWDFEMRIKKLESGSKCKTCRGKIFCDVGNLK